MSTLTDIDYAILMTKITALESRVSKLENKSPISDYYMPAGELKVDFTVHKPTASIKVPQTISQEVLSTNISYNPPDDIRPEDIQNSVINIDDVLRSI